MSTTTFTGTDGDPWPSPWTTVSGSSGIQSGRGRQTTPTGVYNSAEDRYNTTLTDVRVDVIVRFPQVGNGSQRINIRWNPFTGNGYRLLMPTDYNGFQLLRVDAYVETPIHEEFTTVWAVDTDYWVAFEAVGTTLRARRWQVGASEPSTWPLSGTDATYASGDVSLVTVNAVLGGAIHGTWDDVTIAAPTTGAAPSGIAIPASAGSAATALNRSAVPTGLAVTAAVGAPAAAYALSAAPSGKPVPAVAGAPATAMRGATPNGVAVPITLGQPSGPVVTPTPAGVAVPVTVGSAAVSAALTASPAGIWALLVPGSPTVALNRSTAPAGLAAAVSVGTPTTATAGATPSGVAVPAASGAPGSAVIVSVSPAGAAAPVTLGQPGSGPPLSRYVIRPDTGTVTRPNTGLVVRP